MDWLLATAKLPEKESLQVDIESRTETKLRDGARTAFKYASRIGEAKIQIRALLNRVKYLACNLNATHADISLVAAREPEPDL